MKKKLLLIGALSLLAVLSQAFTVAYTLAPNTSTNVLPTSARVTQIAVTATTGTNVTCNIYDSPTNGIIFAQAGYTNTVTYATNISVIYTNFFGVLTTNNLTNVLVDATNNAVGASTVTYPLRFQLSTVASTTYKVDQVNYYFVNGLMATNASSGQLSISVTYFPN